ncbi:MAG: NUDIX hydrolase [Bradymonadia bacterium]
MSSGQPKGLKQLEEIGVEWLEGTWMKVALRTLRNHYDDGTVSPEFLAESAWRRGTDAAAVLPWRRRGDSVDVLLRQCLRPGVDLRHRIGPPVPPDTHHLTPLLWELAAGVPEADEVGHEGMRRCAARELTEEMGYQLPEEDLRPLGAGIYPSGGILSEMLHLYEAEITDDTPYTEPVGDGSPFEEVGACRWWSLSEAIAACGDGRIADAKTEITLWRLIARYGLTPPPFEPSGGTL